MNTAIRHCRPLLAALALLASSSAVAQTSASMTVSGMTDNESGWGYGVDAWFAPIDQWSVGAGFGQSESGVAGAEFSGRSLRLGTDVTLDHFFAGLQVLRWDDSNEVDSRSMEGSIGWLADNGFAISALIDERDLTLRYEVRAPQNQTRPGQVVFSGTGIGADLSFFGEQWTAGLRFLDYRYGRSLARVQAVINAPSTDEFPRLEGLLESILTRAAGAPEREISVMLGRTLRRSSLQGEWLLVRDALTQSDIHSLMLRHGLRLNAHVELQTTLGFSGGGDYDSVAFGGLALTLKR